MPVIFGQPLWLVFEVARAAGKRLRNSVSARSLRIAPAFGSRDHPLASNDASAKNDEAGTVAFRGTGGPVGRWSGSRPPLGPFGSEQAAERCARPDSNRRPPPCK